MSAISASEGPCTALFDTLRGDKRGTARDVEENSRRIGNRGNLTGLYSDSDGAPILANGIDLDEMDESLRISIIEELFKLRLRQIYVQIISLKEHAHLDLPLLAIRDLNLK